MRVVVERDRRAKTWKRKPQANRTVLECNTFDDGVKAGRMMITTLKLRR